MTDSEVKSLLPDYLESNLPPERMRQVEAHLSLSEACREELVFLKRIQGLLASRPRSASPNLWQGIERHIVLQNLQEPWNQFEWVGKRFLPILVAAVLLLAVLGNLTTEAPAVTLEDYLRAQWDEPEALMLSDAELSHDDVLHILQTR